MGGLGTTEAGGDLANEKEDPSGEPVDESLSEGLDSLFNQPEMPICNEGLLPLSICVAAGGRGTTEVGGDLVSEKEDPSEEP